MKVNVWSRIREVVVVMYLFCFAVVTLAADTKARFTLPELTARVDGRQKCTRVDWPSTWVHFLTPVNSGRQLRCKQELSYRKHIARQLHKH